MIFGLTRFCHMWQICAAGASQGFQSKPLQQAQVFMDKVLLEHMTLLETRDDAVSRSQFVQAILLKLFYGQDGIDSITAAQAGLCLRCYVSEPILKACRKIDYLFKNQGCFTYRDLLPFVLNDDCIALLVSDLEGKKQLMLDANGDCHPATHSVFPMQILQKFNPNLMSSMSLDNWAYLQTRQNTDIKRILADCGFQNVSDWALINRVNVTQLKRLSEQEQCFVKVFHGVYRRDRHQQPRRSTVCPHPSSGQLQEMRTTLQQQGVVCDSSDYLLMSLKHIASQLRQYDIWVSREPLDIYDPESQTYQLRSDVLPQMSVSAEFDIEQQEFLTFLNRQLIPTFQDAIEKCIANRLKILEKSKHYRKFSQVYIPGLILYYQQGLSLREIMTHFGMSSWDQARRIFNPGELLSQIRLRTVDQFLQQILTRAEKMGLIHPPPAPDYLNTLVEKIEGFADAEIFQNAIEELHAGHKKRSMDSFYAQQLSLVLTARHQNTTIAREFNHA
jgi:hypothetical protein